MSLNRIQNKILWYVLNIEYAEENGSPAGPPREAVEAYIEALKDAEELPPSFDWRDLFMAINQEFKAKNISLLYDAALGFFANVPETWN